MNAQCVEQREDSGQNNIAFIDPAFYPVPRVCTKKLWEYRGGCGFLKAGGVQLNLGPMLKSLHRGRPKGVGWGGARPQDPPPPPRVPKQSCVSTPRKLHWNYVKSYYRPTEDGTAPWRPGVDNVSGTTLMDKIRWIR